MQLTSSYAQYKLKPFKMLYAIMFKGCEDVFVRQDPPRCISSQFLLSQINATHQYSEIAVSGCKYLCQHLHDTTCSRVFYFPGNRSCILTSRQEIPLKYLIRGAADCQRVVIHERTRCPGRESFCMQSFTELLVRF